MERQRKERLVGAAVIVMLAVIFIPMVLDDSVQPEGGISGTNIPPQPEDRFSSRVVPLTSQAPASTPVTQAVDGPVPPPVVTESSATADRDAASATVSATEPGPASTAPATDVGVTAWVVQLGSFASEENANTLNRKLRQAGFSSFVEPLQQGGSRVFRVRVGPELRRSAAQSVRDRLKSGMELDGIVVPYP